MDKVKDNWEFRFEELQDGTFKCYLSCEVICDTGYGRTQRDALMDALHSRLSDEGLDAFLRWYRVYKCKWETPYHFVTEDFQVYGWVGVTNLKIWRSTEFIHTPWVVNTKDFDYRKGLINTIPTPSTRNMLEEFLMEFIKAEIKNY